MKNVRNKARLNITWFGGLCCNPNAERSIEKTIASLTKGVTIISMLGAIPKTEIARKICIILPVRDVRVNKSSTSLAKEPLAANTSNGMIKMAKAAIR